MSTDPTQRLTDVGRRLLSTLRPLVTPPGFGRLPETCESLLLDPIVKLSDTWAGLLEHPPEKPDSRENRRPPVRNANHAPPLSHAMIDPSNRFGAREEGFWPGEPVLEPFAVEQFLPEPEVAPASSPGTPSVSPERPAARSWSGPIRRARDEMLQTGPARQAAGGEQGSWPESDVPSNPPAGPTLSTEQVTHPKEPFLPGTQDETQQLVPWSRMDSGWKEPSPVVTGDSAAHGLAREDRGEEVSPPAGGVRLATGAARLAAMMREGAVPTEARSRVAHGDRTRLVGPPEEHESHGPVEEPDRSLQGNTVGVEEVMERLADELETGFVRTYGSSGG